MKGFAVWCCFVST